MRGGVAMEEGAWRGRGWRGWRGWRGQFFSLSEWRGRGLIVRGEPLYIGVGKGLALVTKLAFASLSLLC